MKKHYLLSLLTTLLITTLSFGQDLVITAVFDGPLPGGEPKGIELYAVNAIPDLSIYSVGSANNGEGSDGEEFTFPSDALNAGDFIYVASEITNFNSYFGFAPTYNGGSAMGINGDDAIELFMNGNVVDIFGDINTDGTNEPWDYLDGWAYRVSGTGPDGTTFALGNWTYSGPDALDGATTNATAANPIPIGTYSPTGSTDPSISFVTPLNNQVFSSSTTTVPVNFSIQNFTLSGEAMGGGSDGTGDGYIIGTAVENGMAPSSVNIFEGFLDYEELEPGDEVTLTAELVDNNGDSLSPAVTAMVSFSVELPCDLQLEAINTTCDAETSGTDTYTATIDFTGGNTGITYNINSSEGTVGGDNPNTAETGMITITGISEGTNITVTVQGGAGSSCDLTRNITSPVCLPLSCPAEGSIIITEIMQNPSVVGDSEGEYFEVYNTTGSSIDLQGWLLKDTSASSETHTIASSVVVPANGYVVLGVNTDSGTNGGVTVDYDYGSSYFLGNSSDDIVLECGGNTIDMVAWDNGSTFPDPNGASMELAISKYNSTDNDVGANWGEATTEITTGGDLGTPGAVNAFTLSIESLLIEGFAAFPNPVVDKRLTITSQSSDDKQVILYNILGKQVFSQQISGVRETLELNRLQSGLYILKVIEGDRLATTKVVIE